MNKEKEALNLPEEMLCKRCGKSFVSRKMFERISEVVKERNLVKFQDALDLCPRCRKEVFAQQMVGNNLKRALGPKYIPRRRSEELEPVRFDSRTGATVYKTECWSCNDGCDASVFVKDGKVIKVEGDASSPTSRGILCSKGLAAKSLVYHPERLRYPLKRVGERGEGKWQRISWDEALDTIVTKLKEVEQRYGKDAVVMSHGTSRGWFIHFVRLANVLHYQWVGPGIAQCFWPRYTAQILLGIFPALECPDVYLHPDKTKCMLVWGTNPANTTPIRAAWIMDAKGLGAKMIVVDPLFSETASKADLWLQLRPGTDGALALGMLNVIVNQGLYDQDFVEKWCTGFKELRERVLEYPPEKVERITWVPKEKIVKAARLFATTKPACVVEWLAIEQVPDSMSTCLALAILAVITGNIDVPGGNIFPMPREVVYWLSAEVNRIDLITKEEHEKRLGSKAFPLLAGEDAWLASSHAPTLWRAILTGKPYPVRAMYNQGSNPALSYANTKLVIKALKSLDFLAVADFFMTPTAELADIVLPVATWLERSCIAQNFQVSYNTVHLQQKVVDIEECWSDYDIINELGRRFGYGHLMFKSEEDYCDFLLKPSGITFDEFKKMGAISVPYAYKKYEKRGSFRTPEFENLHASNKIELYSHTLKRLGFDPLPSYKEPTESPISTPELAEEYPLIVTTGRKEAVFRHTESRNIPWLREIVPNHETWINPKTAAELGIKQGDPIVIESPRGSIESKAYVTEGIGVGVVLVPAQWPGKNDGNSLLHDEDTAPAIGGTQLRCQLCRVRRAE